jgi:hypothetical protein
MHPTQRVRTYRGPTSSNRRQKGAQGMIRRLRSLAFTLAACLLVKSMPDIARYLKIRNM